jgi:hypothetical protein
VVLFLIIFRLLDSLVFLRIKSVLCDNYHVSLNYLVSLPIYRVEGGRDGGFLPRVLVEYRALVVRGAVQMQTYGGVNVGRVLDPM